MSDFVAFLILFAIVGGLCFGFVHAADEEAKARRVYFEKTVQEMRR